MEATGGGEECARSLYSTFGGIRKIRKEQISVVQIKSTCVFSVWGDKFEMSITSPNGENSNILLCLTLLKFTCPNQKTILTHPREIGKLNLSESYRNPWIASKETELEPIDI